MKDNPNLPKRQYYRLAQAADELDCTTDYLIHAGSLDAVSFMVRPPFGTALKARVLWLDDGAADEAQNIRSETLMDWTVMNWTFFELRSITLGTLENDREAYVGSIQGEWPPSANLLAESVFDRFTEFPPRRFLLLDVHVTADSDYGKLGEIIPCDDSEGFWITSDDLWVPAEEVERLKRGEPARRKNTMPPALKRELMPEARREPGQKSINAYLRTIAALSQALIKKDLSQPHKDAGVILAAIAGAGIVPPIKEDALANYLKEAGEVEKKSKG